MHAKNVFEAFSVVTGCKKGSLLLWAATDVGAEINPVLSSCLLWQQCLLPAVSFPACIELLVLACTLQISGRESGLHGLSWQDLCVLGTLAIRG